MEQPTNPTNMRKHEDAGSSKKLVPVLNKEQITAMRSKLLSLHMQNEEEQIWKEESKTQSFVRRYTDNEIDHEEESKL